MPRLSPRLLFALALLPITGCGTLEVDVRPGYAAYDRVAFLASVPREAEDLFLPLYMKAFPSQTVVERRDIEKVLGEQDLKPERLDEPTRAKMRRVLGVKSILFLTGGDRHLAFRAVDTETGAISASVFVSDDDDDKSERLERWVRKTVNALSERAGG